MEIIKLLSPNFSHVRSSKRKIEFIIIHYTGMQSEIESLKRLLSKKSKVSAHYLITRSGKILNLVNVNKVAWHAGKSRWGNFNNLNINSIGIELQNRGHKIGYERYPKKQISALIKLCAWLKKKFKIKSANVLGHSDIAPLRKIDPGEKFPWKLMSKKKISIWFNEKNLKNIKYKYILREKKVFDVRSIFFKNLYKIGYRYFSLRKKNSAVDKKIIKSFQRRFVQENISGKISKKTLEISHFLSK